jgi:1-acyl-sn-glycerol-3-phosphate acyltransferase
LLYFAGMILLRGVFFLLTRCQVHGRENVPRRGAIIVVSNHLSVIDPPLLVVVLGRKTAFMAKEELFVSRLSAFLVRRVGGFPVSKKRLNRDAMKKADEVLEKGRALAIFPEGMRSRQASLKSAYAGSALIALRNRVPLLPVGITGTEVIKGLGWLWRRPKVTVDIGIPFYLPQIDAKISKEKTLELTERVMRSIAELLPLKYQGIYALKRKGLCR